MRKELIERAYQVIGQPLDVNFRVPQEIADIVDYREAAAGEDVYRFIAPAENRAPTVITVTSTGELAYEKVDLKTPTVLTFAGIQSKLETVLLDEILNSKDVTALAAKKEAIIRQMDNEEAKRVMDLCLGATSQKIVKATGEDLLDVIIRMKQKVSNYSTDYILLGASDVIDAIEAYDKRQITNANYNFPIKQQLADLNISKVVKVLGFAADGTTPVLASGTAILVGRNSNLTLSKPLVMVRRLFNGEVAQLSGAPEGAVRLIELIPLPISTGAAVVLGYSVIGYEQIAQAMINYYAVAYSETIIA